MKKSILIIPILLALFTQSSLAQDIETQQDFSRYQDFPLKQLIKQNGKLDTDQIYKNEDYLRIFIRFCASRDFEQERKEDIINMMKISGNAVICSSALAL